MSRRGAWGLLYGRWYGKDELLGRIPPQERAELRVEGRFLLDCILLRGSLYIYIYMYIHTYTHIYIHIIYIYIYIYYYCLLLLLLVLLLYCI